MRTITLIAALFLLTSCGGEKEAAAPATTAAAPQPPATPKIDARLHGLGADESSPIVISEGSIHITQTNKDNDHFRMKGPKKAFVKLQNHQPNSVGYGCNAGNDCATACVKDQPSLTSKCFVDFVNGVSEWTLALCEASVSCDAPGTVLMNWATAKDNEKIVIESSDKEFKIKEGSTSTGAELQHTSASKTLTRATLVLKRNSVDETYRFDCSKFPALCVTLDYSCHVSGNAKCGGN